MTDHRPTRNDLPDPLTGFGGLNLATWALPATMLALGSSAVLLIVLAFLQRSNEMRRLFILPFASSWLAVPAAVLAWLVVVRCRGRPGRNFPRYWTLGLAILTTAIAAVCLTELAVLPVSFVHALAVAGFAAVLVLLPRLIKVRPDSGLVQRLALASLLLVLLIVLPTAYLVGQKVVDSHGDRIDRRMERLRRWLGEIRETTAYDWSSMAEDPEGAARQVKRLEELSLSGAMSAPGLWEAAVVLEREDELRQEFLELVGALVEGADPARAPKLSDLEPAATTPNFQRLSGVTGDYYRHLGRLFLELEAQITPEGPAALADLAPKFQEERKRFQAHLAAHATSWTNFGAVQVMPKSLVPEDLRGSPLAVLLGLPMASGLSGALPPAADLPQLMNLTLGAGEPLALQAANCLATERFLDPGHGEHENLRLECRAFSPPNNGADAMVRIEVHVLYKSERFTRLDHGVKPAAIVYRFPVPERVGATELRHEVIQDLGAAFERLGIGGLGAAGESSLSGTGGLFHFELKGGPEAVELRITHAPASGDG